MDTKIQFQKDATVLAANGKDLGSLNRVVVDPNTKELAAIVVRTHALFSLDERVIPIESVAETTPDHIILREDAETVDTFPPFEEEHIVDTEESVEHGAPVVPPMLYGSPVYGTPPIPTIVEDDLVTRIEQNIPEGTVAMKEGAKVISADGKHVGEVERVFTGVPNEKITHLLVSNGTIKKKTKLVPIDWVNTVDEDEVNLRVNKVSIDNLADTSVRW